MGTHDVREHKMPRERKDIRKQPKPAPARKPEASQGGKRATIARALSKLGYCSRTQAEELVTAGRVSLAGRIVRDLQTWVDLSDEAIAVDGKPVTAEKRVYLMLNKPRGLVTTRHDPEGRPTVFDCLKDLNHTHLSPVGRLDKASEGLLLFTNDTEFSQSLLDPETHVPKTYHVQIDRIATDEMLQALTSGIRHDGELLHAESVTKLREGDRNSWLEVVLDEGRNRQIRRMLEALDIATLRLLRVSIGNLPLGDLEKGAVRSLTDKEVEDLRSLVAAKAAQ